MFYIFLFFSVVSIISLPHFLFSRKAMAQTPCEQIW